ncbi:hypothetical protein KIN20_021704, partial [Parelaphostrongylus tenuis]
IVRLLIYHVHSCLPMGAVAIGRRRVSIDTRHPSAAPAALSKPTRHFMKEALSSVGSPAAHPDRLVSQFSSDDFDLYAVVLSKHF